MRLRLTVDLSVRKRDLHPPETIEGDLKGQWIKVKSGEYENQLMGVITAVETVDKVGEEEFYAKLCNVVCREALQIPDADPNMHTSDFARAVSARVMETLGRW